MKNDLKEKIMRRRVATCEDDALSSTTTFRASQCGISHYPLPVQNAENSNVSLKKGNKIMTKEETKQRIAVMQAYVDGKQVQVYDISLSKWIDTNAPLWITSRQFRIKPEPSYRPFRNAEECWQEMLEHVPFGWITDNEPQNGAPHDGGQAILIVCVHDVVVSVSPYFEEDENGNIQRNTVTDGHSTYEQALKNYWFMDGTPFGIKEEDNCK